ncbi:MAG: methyltransferase, partial [Lentisphaerota bacterium]
DIVFETVLKDHPFHFHTTWGLFSPRDIDDGSRLLIDHVKTKESDVTLDIGCGYGPIGLAIAKSTPAGTVHLVDKDFMAIEYAKKNAAANDLANCKIYLSNAFSAVEEMAFDNIVSNLPGQVGRELLFIILSDAKARLKPGGQMVVVTISGLREFIKWNFKEVFGNYQKLEQGRTHTVALAIKEASPSELRIFKDPPQSRSYRTQPHKMKLKDGRNLDHIQALPTQIEGDDHR